MFNNDGNGLQRSASSKNWFSRGRDLVEESRYEDALVCFEESHRLGHPKSEDGIPLCQKELGLI